MRPGQQEIISSVARAIWQQETLLVSAPTGIGKTMAVLYPAVKQALKLGKKLFYLTSKTLQQDAAVEALRRLNDGSFRVLRIRAKQKMCAHTEMICHEDFCPFAARYTDKMTKSGLLTNIVTGMSYFDPDITFELAKSTEVCPFEVSLELIEQADVIVCDYNYIFDPYVGLKTYSQENDYGDCVLLVDEAHNLVERGRGYYSPELHEKTFDEIRTHMMSRNCWVEGWEDLLDVLRSHFHEMAQGLEDDLRQTLCEPSRELFMEQRVEWERIVLEYIGWKIENRIAEESDPLIDFYFKLVKFANLLAEDGDEFAHDRGEDDDGHQAQDLLQRPLALPRQDLRLRARDVALSATLEPFDFYRTTLGFPNDRTAELSLPSPFPRVNRKIVVSPEWTRRTSAARDHTNASRRTSPRSPTPATATSSRSSRATRSCARSRSGCRRSASGSWSSATT
jgi:Rad3-related DNA helicase